MAKINNIDSIIERVAVKEREAAKDNVLYLVASGDLRESANLSGWKEQLAMEENLKAAFAKRGYELVRPYEVVNHGFINSQKMGNEVFQNIPEGATVVIAESVWQYSHHVLGPLVQRKDLKILTVANYDGTWPGLVGLSNLNACLVKHNRPFATVWSEDFTDDAFHARLDEFFEKGTITYAEDHIRAFGDVLGEAKADYADAIRLGEAQADRVLRERAIAGYLDEMCMGMENAVFGNEKLYDKGIGKENISQSELVARMTTVSDEEGLAVIDWLREKGMTFEVGKDEESELTERQLIEQGKMYVAAVRIANKYGCDVIGIQYQQGLKDCCPASDLVEGLLNNVDRPPVKGDEEDKPYFGEVIRPGRAIPCFNEADGGCAMDLILSNPLWNALDQDPAANQEDIRWSRKYTGPAKTSTGKVQLEDEEIWVELLSGSAPASHFEGGYANAKGFRQSAVYFPLGGSTLFGVGKEGEVVVSRVYIQRNGRLAINIMRGAVVGLPEDETQDRLDRTCPVWPIKHLVRYGVKRDDMLLHPSNHETILYADDAETANNLMFAKAAMAQKMGFDVYIWGNYDLDCTMEKRGQN